jgi:YgiT-type zinc finger domain-containing protein
MFWPSPTEEGGQDTGEDGARTYNPPEYNLKQNYSMEPYGNCSFCGGEVVEREQEIDYRHKGKLYILINVPAGDCTQRGERFFKAEIAKKMEPSVSPAPDNLPAVPVPAIRISSFGPQTSRKGIFYACPEPLNVAAFL